MDTDEEHLDSSLPDLRTVTFDQLDRLPRPVLAAALQRAYAELQHNGGVYAAFHNALTGGNDD